ncbi:MAG: ATP-dependent DNA ligase [Burkholderiales bacterium]
MTYFSTLAAVSGRVAQTPGRLAKVRELADYLRALETGEVPTAVAYLSGETRQGKLGVSYAAVRTTGATAHAGTPPLTIADVDTAFGELASITGPGATGKRMLLLQALLARATPDEQDFLQRLIVGELRQGALQALVLEAVAAASGVKLADARKAAMAAGGIAGVAQALMHEGAAALARFSIRLMQPVLPMLSQSAPAIEDALRTLGTAALEWKLDGARVQVHKQGDNVRVFTRNLNDVTARVPEIVAAVRASPQKNLILDGEAIALRPDGTPHSFQLTMQRFGRKLDVEAKQRELPLSVFFFDCLLSDDEALVERPASERFRVLEAALPPALIIPRIVTAEPVQAAQFFEHVLAQGHEGVVAKSLAAPYEAGRRGAGWIKIKRANTLDLVVLAAEWGSGRRKGRLSNLHLGARDDINGGYVMLGKTFKGLTDQMLEWQTQEFLRLETYRDEMAVHVRREIVVEIAFNEIQASSRYPGGLALRFARVKGYRPDKRAEAADNIATVRALYAAQEHAEGAAA